MTPSAVVHSTALIAALAACCLLAVAAWCDIATRLLPNRLSIAIAALGLLLRALHAAPAPLAILRALAASLAIACAVFVAAALCWRRGWIGGGDVKLLAAVSLTAPPDAVLPLIVSITYAGGLLALVYLALGRLLPRPSPIAPARRLRRVLRVELRRIRRRFSLPYASAIAAGGLFIMIRG